MHDPTLILNIHSCIFKMICGSAGRQIDRTGTKYRSVSMYLIDVNPCMFIRNER